MTDYKTVLTRLVPRLPEAEQEGVLREMAVIRTRLDNDNDIGSSSPPKQAVCTGERNTPTNNTQRYLGEVSDVRFFNLVERVLQKKPSAGDAPHIDVIASSYEQEVGTPGVAALDVPHHLPSPEAAAEYLDIYFSTVHIAYPFVPKSAFMARYRQLRVGKLEDADSSWYGILCKSHFR